MPLLLLIVGIFAGLFVFMATVYSLSQVILTQGRVRWAHVAAIGCVLAVMAALQMHEMALARLLSVPLIGAAIFATAMERGLYRVFPILQQVFGVVVLAGLVVL